MKGHTLYCHRHASAARPSRRGVAGRKIHLRHQTSVGLLNGRTPAVFERNSALLNGPLALYSPQINLLRFIEAADRSDRDAARTAAPAP